MRLSKEQRKQLKKQKKEHHKKLPIIRNYRLYALFLEEGNYYIGSTALSAEARYRQHATGSLAAKWTKKYKPLYIIETRELGICSQKDAIFAENMMTIEYMDLYGLNKVRGGDMCAVNNYYNIHAYNLRKGQYIFDYKQR